MSERSKFWQANTVGDGVLGPYDEPTDVAEVLAEISGCLSKTTNNGGVFQGELNGLSVSGSTTPVTVATGRAFVYGTFYENDAALSVSVPTPTTATRIDRIVVRKDWQAQKVRVVRVQGAEGGSAPALVQQVNNQWDIPLATLSVTTAGAITVTDGREFVPITATITGILGINQGGTGRSSLTANAVLIGEGTSAVNFASPGTAGNVLTSNGANADPTFQVLPTAFIMPAGSVTAYAGTSAPTGWLLCNGTAVNRTTYASLFSVIGTTFGAGDGSTTFNLPDLLGRTPVGVDSGSTRTTGITAVGNNGGEQTHTQTAGEMPSHTHTATNTVTDPAHTHTATVTDPTHTHNIPLYTQGAGANNNPSNTGTAGSTGNYPTAAAATGITVANASVTTGVTVATSNATAGGGSAFNVMQPYLALNYIIKT